MAPQDATNGATLNLPSPVADAMRAAVPRVAEECVLAISSEVPAYADPFSGEMGRTIEGAVALALGGFLEIVAGDEAGAAIRMDARVAQAAYDLGRGEARSGRPMDALLAAYRVGARVSWRDLGAVAVYAGLDASAVARFAELVFAYIDQLSATSAAGHADERATTGRVRQRYLERLTQSLLRGEDEDVAVAHATRADWAPPSSLTAVLLPDSQARAALAHLDARTLQPTEQVPGLEARPDYTVLLVPAGGGRARATLLRRLRGRDAVVGPPRPWLRVHESHRRALRSLDLVGTVAADEDGAALDSEAVLEQLVLQADRDALDDLRALALAPLAELRPAAAEKLRETLRAWLLHHGRREEIAAALYVHPQTVRYRMQQLRALYGERLDDPVWVLRLTLALA